jgi:FkbM family methyltransferase
VPESFNYCVCCCQPAQRCQRSLRRGDAKNGSTSARVVLIAFCSSTVLAYLLSRSNPQVRLNTSHVTPVPSSAQTDLNGLTRECTKYGGWWYDSRKLHDNAVIYSFGLGEDTSWDEALIRRGASVHGFDPTPKSTVYVEEREELKNGPGKFYHTKEGLWTEDTTLQFTLPDNPEHASLRAREHDSSQGTVTLKVNTLSNFLAANGHSKIDILKIDVEGAEYDFLDQLLNTNYFPFEQLLVEFHHRFLESGKEKQDLLLLRMFHSGFAISRNEDDQEISFHKVYKREL